MKPGVAVMREGQSPLWRVEALRGKAIRLPLVHWSDDTEYLREARERGLDVLGVMDRDAFRDWDRWQNSVEEDFERIDRLYVKTGLVTAVAFGNECDDGWQGEGDEDDPRVRPRGGISSWVMPFSEQGEMIENAYDYWRIGGTRRTRIPLVLGGLSSGQPSALYHFDLAKLSGVQVHPYGKRPEVGWPHDSWGTGYIGWLLDPMRQIIDGSGHAATCRLGVGELGLSHYNAQRGTIAEWFRRMMRYLEQRGDIDFAFVFCDSDHNVDGYGQFDVGEHPKPSVAEIVEAHERLGNPPLLILPEEPVEPEEPEEPEEPVEPEPPGWWDRHFSAEEIATVLASLRTRQGRPTDPSEVLADIEANVPEFRPFMETYGWTDNVNAKVALYATIFVECAWEVRPRDEIGSYDYFERNYGYQTNAGLVLGNLYPGDGARYKGRGYQLTGRANYAHFGELLDVPLIDMPEEANHPAVAAGCIVAFMHERGVFEQARRGNWEQVRRLYNGGLNGWEWFWQSVQALIAVSDEDPAVDPDGPEDQRTLSEKLQTVLNEGMRHQGAPYVWDGKTPAGFDCSEFIRWCYQKALGIDVPGYTDAIWGATDGISEAQSLPGDIVLYEYDDPSQPNTTYPHVGLVTQRADITLDARSPMGVGFHAHVPGAIRRYRRVRGLAGALDKEEMMWRDKFINTVAHIGDIVADQLEIERAALDDYGEPPKLPKPIKKMLKADWQAHAQALEKWSARVRENTDARYQGIGAVGSELRRIRAEEVGPRPS